jgi:hypothetical protein
MTVAHAADASGPRKQIVQHRWDDAEG